MRPLLAIAIPTNNRFAILRENLLEMLPELVETGVTVHVSDGSTDDLTRDGIVEIQRTHPGVFYHRSVRGLAYDGNCQSALGLPSADYVWYLADGYRILPGGLKRVLAVLMETPCDFLVVNSSQRGAIDLPAGLYRDATVVLERLAWHMTLAGSTIFAREHLTDIGGRYQHFLGTNFSHLGIALENLPRCRFGLRWLDEKWLTFSHRKRSYWAARTIEVFARDWSEFVLALADSYPIESKMLAIREHSIRTGILELRSLARLRRLGQLDHAEVLRYERHLRMASGVPFLFIELLARAPRWMARPLAKLGRFAMFVGQRQLAAAPGGANPPGA